MTVIEQYRTLAAAAVKDYINACGGRVRPTLSGFISTEAGRMYDWVGEGDDWDKVKVILTEAWRSRANA